MTTAKELAAEINKLMGKDVLSMASDKRFAVTKLPTGVMPMDVLLEGGLPRGRIVEIYGNYSTLKSFVGLRAIAMTQAAGGVCALIDTEHTFEPEWAGNLGVDTKDLIVMHPDNGEEAVDVTQALVAGGVDLVVWDSVAATLPKDEQEKMAGDKVQPGRQAALFSRGLRKLVASNDHTAILFINQTREKIGITYGSPETTPGGKALPFYASYRVKMTRIGTVKDETAKGDKLTVAFKVKASLEKSKLSKPFADIDFIFSLREGDVDLAEFILTRGLESGLVSSPKKNHYVLAGYGELVFGKDRFKEWLRETTDLNEVASGLLLTVSPGESQPPKSKGVAKKAASSRATEPDLIPAAARVLSPSTGRTTKRSSKSSTPPRATKSAGRTSKGSTKKRPVKG